MKAVAIRAKNATTGVDNNGHHGRPDVPPNGGVHSEHGEVGARRDYLPKVKSTSAGNGTGSDLPSVRGDCDASDVENFRVVRR